MLEKVDSLDEFGHKLNFPVSGFYGSEGQIPLPNGSQICVATIEKVRYLIIPTIYFIGQCDRQPNDRR